MSTLAMVVGFPNIQPANWRNNSSISSCLGAGRAMVASAPIRGKPVIFNYPCRRRQRKVVVAAEMNSKRGIAFDSTIWGDHFLSFTPQLTEITAQEKLEVEELKEKVTKMLGETPDDSTEKLVLIDAIQRLGVAYHFPNEIETSLRNIFDASQHSDNNIDDNIYVVALRFRLMRQQGHYMSSDVFKKFTNHDGKFKKTLSNDVQALLSLYEASHMRFHGEDILEEALIFTTTHLESMIPVLTNNSLKVQVTAALDQPIRKTVLRVGARKYINLYENIEEHNDLLLKFAKLDFNVVQKLHQEELHDLTRWCNDLDFDNKYPYVRDMTVDAFFWVIGLCFEPQVSHERKMLTKFVLLNTIIDDTYDTYGTFDELVLFTDAIQRWDMNVVDSLPPYMRIIYQDLMNLYKEMEQVLTKEGKSDSILYVTNELKELVTAYFTEARWLNAGYMPKCEEYIKNGYVTSTIKMYVTISLVVFEEFITKETFEWVTKDPRIVRAASKICRLYDDITDYEFDKKRRHVPSLVECYMKEYGASKEVAYGEIRKEITNAWKDINKDFLHPMEAPFFALQLALSSAQLIDTFFKDGRDGYTNPKSKVKDMLTLLFAEPVKI